MDVNVKGPFYLTAKSIPLMLKNGGGSVVNVASIDGIQPGQMRVVYGMTKAAVINMTKGFAKEYGNQGIRVNALLPGFTAWHSQRKWSARFFTWSATKQVISQGKAWLLTAEPLSNELRKCSCRCPKG